MKFFCVVGAFICSALLSAAVPATTTLPRSTPEAEGVSSAAILGFIATAEAKIDAVHSFMLVRHGQMVLEGWGSPYTADKTHKLNSLTKSFTATAVGLAIAEGKLSLDDKVVKFFPTRRRPTPAPILRR